MKRESFNSSVLPLFAMIVLLLSVASAEAQTFTVLHAFSGTDGSDPNGDLIRDAVGNIYGTTLSGGSSSSFAGVVFKIDPLSNLTVLHSFNGQSEGGMPLGRLLADSQGNLYGMTGSGGDPTCNCGTVFKLAPDGTLTVLHSFHGGTDGKAGGGFAHYGLVAIGGALYGATQFGGTPGCDGNIGCGVIFKVDLSGTETVVHRFSGGADGGFPSDLIRDQSGNLYGITEGSTQGANDGAVFKLDGSGVLTVLHNFTGGADGGSPMLRLAEDTNGIFYGTTGGDGGEVFSLDSGSDHISVLHKFGSRPADGLEAAGGVLNVGGSLFGVADFGGITNSFAASAVGWSTDGVQQGTPFFTDLPAATMEMARVEH